MISLSTKPDRNGFWYLIEVSEDCHFTLSYVVVGAGGRQSSGEVTGSATNTRQWQFQRTDFPVLRVGITDLRVDEHSTDVPKAYQVQQQVDSLPRRKAIKTFASAFLAGGAMLLLPLSSSSGTTLSIRGAVPEELSPSPNPYNPYHDEGVNSYSPY